MASHSEIDLSINVQDILGCLDIVWLEMVRQSRRLAIDYGVHIAKAMRESGSYRATRRVS
ncbi:MAG: hypothetical protein V2I36_11960 [Desulfopila sp.]|jgi:hypothetical protein|nr:hypothetical protein [Desulfopila sp.]